MKCKNVFLMAVLIIMMTVISSAQIQVTSENSLSIPNSPSSIRFGNTTSGSVVKGNWGIEYFDGGLNFWRPWPNTNWTNYNLFLQDDGKIGIGRKPLYGMLEINGEGSYGGLSIFNGTGNTFRLFRQSNNVYFTRNGSTSQGIIMTSDGHIGINRIPSTSFWLDVNGSIRINSSVYTSDKRMKNNINELENVVENLSRLKGVSYNLNISAPSKSLDLNSIEGEAIEEVEKEEPVVDERLHFGFIAQDLQEIFPELVYADDDGILGIDYISIIPLLVEAIKIQNLKIESIEQELASSRYYTSNLDIKVSSSSLKQNSPNPFSVSTEIKYSIAEASSNANIYIYDMQGAQLNSYNILTKGNGSIQIQASQYKPGMYMYSLIVDGKEIDTKRMILTE